MFASCFIPCAFCSLWLDKYINIKEWLLGTQNTLTLHYCRWCSIFQYVYLYDAQTLDIVMTLYFPNIVWPECKYKDFSEEIGAVQNDAEIWEKQ